MCMHDRQQTTENSEEGIPIHLCLEAQGEIEVAYGCKGVMWRTNRGWEGVQQAQEDGQGSESEGASFTSSSAWGPGLSLEENMGAWENFQEAGKYFLLDRVT